VQFVGPRLLLLRPSLRRVVVAVDRVHRVRVGGRRGDVVLQLPRLPRDRRRRGGLHRAAANKTLGFWERRRKRRGRGRGGVLCFSLSGSFGFAGCGAAAVPCVEEVSVGCMGRVESAWYYGLKRAHNLCRKASVGLYGPISNGLSV
jgi:hypothetical protein